MSVDLVTMFSDSVTDAEQSFPDKDRLVDGEPRHLSWNIYESPDGRLFSGLWESTPGCWRVIYDEWEFCHIVHGISILTDENGKSLTVRAGDAFTISPGFRGTWRVVETTRKHYVIRLPG